ncbi:synaptotagmin-16 [Cylas formicarius]|uniref:synaptotagmin-16 n=1 Tax=Cylas formicarius TaxID=197179 RepID=UPI002958A7CC|nr:synaptotagmin-16 [Cylas formicarius]XP_060516222.1 synaptotagmin-16 [Cylas formicarius]XP_060516231.1 synaptotagmin-16 [Cylas formicarius]
MVAVSHTSNFLEKDGAIFGALIGCSAFLVLLFLYARNKGWWSGSVRNIAIACCDEACPPVSGKPRTNSIVDHSSSVSFYKPSTTALVSTSHGDAGDSSTESEITGTSSRKNSEPLPAGPPPPFLPPRQDIISLVEKGRIGISSNSSCCSSTTSSVGDRQTVISVAKVIAEVNPAMQDNLGQMEIKETKIEHQSSSYYEASGFSHGDKNDFSSNKDCIVVMNPENEDDAAGSNNSTISCLVRDEIGADGRPLSLCGHLEVSLWYDAPMRKMTVHVLQACNIPSRDRGQPTQTQVRLILLPSKKQKHKTKIRSGENPQYREKFILHRVNPEDVNSMGIRLRLYGCEKMRRERLIGEALIRFATINLEVENNFWLSLQPRVNTELSAYNKELSSMVRSDSIGSSQSIIQHGGIPELLLGLSYNAITGRLSVEVIKGSHFRNLSLNRAPDSYIKLSLVSSTGQELAHSKTSVRRSQPNPLFKETFVFQVALFQLADVTLMVAVYNRKGVTKKKEMIGWFSLGLNSSGAEELAHWMDMKEFQQEQICRWHILVQS